MPVIYVVHIFAGSMALLSGYVALYSAKGAIQHRRSGMVFVLAMLTMSVAGTTLAAVRNAAPALNIPVALLTSYLVITSLATVRSFPFWSWWIDAGLMLLAFAVGLIDLSFAFEAFASSDGTRNGMPAIPFLMFGFVALLAGVLDLRMIRSGGLEGASRITRHLWRMTVALLIAALSFFIGQAKVIPEPIRIMPLLVLPVLAVLVTLLYWLWRVRFRRSLRGIVVSGQRRDPDLVRAVRPVRAVSPARTGCVQQPHVPVPPELRHRAEDSQRAEQISGATMILDAR